ncbi:xaa-Pro aminopeptidase 1 [Bombyx mori]|uniref:xaa-Pro aminopeptidase 1 n=1 Tax=Bombyx mori TaxID=7091 RepID=UPI002ED03951
MSILKILSVFLIPASVYSAVRITQQVVQTTTTQTPPPAPVVSTASFAVLDEIATFTTAPVCPDAINTSVPLGRLRTALRNSAYLRKDTLLDAFIVFFSDEHLSEEPSPEERRLEYISGWDGAGTAAVLADGGAAIWVPSGDVHNARATLSCAWEVLDGDDPSQRTISEWIVDRLGRKGRVGGDARLTSVVEWQTISSSLHREGLLLIDVPTLVDQLWNDEVDPPRRRPEFSKIVANKHQMEYVGMSWREKVSAVRNELRAVGAEAIIITALDEVAWLLNVRGRDVPYAPLLKAFVIVSLRDVRVFAPPGKLSMPVRKALDVYNCFTNNCTRVNDYTAIYDELRRSSESKILIPAAGTFQRGASAAIAQSVPLSKRVFLLSPIIYLKAQKNEAEAKGMRKAHLRDAVAMCTLFSYLENKSGLSEMSVQTTVDITRETQAGYVGPAMQTRVAYGPSAVEPEYRPNNATNRRIYKNSTLVIRSGGQYDEGTTVVTRTVHYGTPSREERRAYTTVLRAVAALSAFTAPSTLPAAHADPVARAPLWAADQDYPHPTGHGVGAALNRREDPVVIDYRQDTNLHTLREGYFITCEPGWYEPGKFGIRLGNVVEVIGKPNEYLGFREATLLPYEPKLIDKNMLTEYEITWLNGYNDRIRKIVGPELMSQGLTDVYYWMMNKTAPYELPSKAKKAQMNSAVHIAGIREIVALISFISLTLFS